MGLTVEERKAVVRENINFCTRIYDGVVRCGPFTYEEFIRHLMDHGYGEYTRKDVDEVLTEMLTEEG